MAHVVKVVCSVCTLEYDEKKVEKDPKGRLSHGMCSFCGPRWHAEQMAEVGELLKKEMGGGDSNV